MNKAKKTIKGQNGQKQVKKNVQEGTNKGKIFVGILVAFLVVVSALVGWENLHPKLILTINGQKTYLGDLTYQIMTVEQTHNSIASLYEQMGYTEDYWSMEQDGQTVQATAKQQVLDSEIQQQILYAEAVKNGYEATEEQKASATASAQELLESLSDTQIKKTGFTEEKLTEILTRYEVTKKYKEDLIAGFAIDEEAIRAEIDRDEYNEYKTQCFFVSTEADADGEELSDAEKAELWGALLKVGDDAKDTEDWSTFLDSEDEDALVSYQEMNFIKSDTAYDEAVMNAAMKLGNGEISDIIEGEDGYYIIKMVDNNSDERYEAEVESAITEEEDSRFEEEYYTIYAEYDIKIDETEWGKVTLGSLTM
jgi:foldase protein PrsA